MSRDADLVRALCRWFEGARRDLPWRRTDAQGRRDPYRSLVSEIMLQQTQVSRAAEKFGPFIARFPTLGALADADESEVLAMWSGLGYYRRARGLHRAAREAVARFGALPTDAADLATLPGIGRYTAGAIASIVHDQPSPIVDGNVARVLLRLEGQPLERPSSEAERFCWSRAEELVQRAHRSRARGVSAGVFNEAMMELGALVCTPRNPACGRCPLRNRCRAFETGRQHEIPRPGVAAKKRDLHLACVRVRDGRGRLFVEQRPENGLWGGLWQPPTLETQGRATKARIAGHFGLASRSLIADDAFLWETSHRSVHFRVFRATHPPITSATGQRAGRWVSPRELDGLALGSPQRRALLGSQSGGEAAEGDT